MKKILSLFAITAFLMTSCSSDDNTPIRPEQKDQVEVGTSLPITGYYVFPHTPTMPLPFKFESDKITISFVDNNTTTNEVYNVIRVYKNTTNIIKAVTTPANGKGYKTFFFRNQTETTVQIHMDYDFDNEKDAINTAYPTDQKTTKSITVKADNPHGSMKFGWLQLNKEQEKVQNIDKLKGVYGSEVILDKDKNPQAQYVFKLNNNDEAFLFRADMGNGLGESASFTLKKVATDEVKGQLIFEVTGSTGYYKGRTGQFLTVYVKDITTDGSKATFAIATKDGSGSVAGSKGDIVGKTIEEAKTIKAPEADKVWDNDMMNYAHRWMQTTRE